MGDSKGNATSQLEAWAQRLRELQGQQSAPEKEEAVVHTPKRPRSNTRPHSDSGTHSPMGRSCVYVYVRWTGPFEGVNEEVKEMAKRDAYAYVGKRKIKRNRVKQWYVMLGKVRMLVSEPDIYGAVFLVYEDEG